ncbi:GTP cyclohydrolase FolE2 [Mycobacterium asiaticum]|uniref:GTP cyclohydrolase FolE2 n=1 Tax=Mycobacterium asiaticum TaxID=1790 RepID=UPI000686039B|nr:GTP cyclohydrolase FolE2 [Mycobacterium asiaticum]ORA15562.1 GTP cyclohydrolase [Mycobacterium asiaticum DSM 44297]
MTTLVDIQSETDDRGVAIEEVGISGLRYPVSFDDGDLRQSTTADIELTISLPADRRGTHMSRMVQLVDSHLGVINPYELTRVLKAAGAVLEVDKSILRVQMPLATRLAAPTSGEEGWQVHDVELEAGCSADRMTLRTSVSCDVTTLCPCSKAISDYGAHNQRSRVTLSVQGCGDSPYPMSVSKLVQMIRASGSCAVYPVVKRPDERAITMAAYENPRFVEDVVRELSIACRTLLLPHQIQARNIESIHSHDAIARLRWSPDRSQMRYALSGSQ